jgi:histidinol-phosphate aminotransferase
MIRPRNQLVDVERTPPRVATREGTLRLDSNERIVPFPEAVLQRFRELLTDESIMMYPEPERVYRRLAAYLAVDRRELLLSAGSDAAIKAVYETYIDPGDRVVIHLPSYAMHGVYARMFQADLDTVCYDADLRLDLSQFLNAITNGTRMVVFENPNGFIGTVQPADAIRTIVEKAYRCGALVLLDEAYYLFSGQTNLDLYREYDNVIVCRTLSKDFGIAGLRAGYMMSREGNIRNLYRVKPMHEVSSAALAFTQAMLEYPAEIESYVAVVQAGLAFLRTALHARGLATSDSRTNFLIVRLPDGTDLDLAIRRLGARGCLVRRPFDLATLKGWLRVTAGGTGQMQRFVAAVDEVLAELR